MPDADEAWRKQVEQEAAQELLNRECHQALLIAVRGVAPAKGDLLIGQRDQSMVVYGNAMCVPAQVTEDMFRATEGPFAVDDPSRVGTVAAATRRMSSAE